MNTQSAIVVDDVKFAYGSRQALMGVSFEVSRGEIFGLLGPNGSGKTTLFRLLSTLLPLQSGNAALCGSDVRNDPDGVRRHIGVTFQSPSLDGKLTVRENLLHQGRLYGLTGSTLKQRCREVLSQLHVEDRAGDSVEKLSGGLKRRVEIAKCLLHSPEILLLDEPSTGLDPGARHSLWETLNQLQAAANVTVLVTTHLMEEADRCHRLALLDVGRLIALGTPDQLRASVGGDSVTIETDTPEELTEHLQTQLGLQVIRVGHVLRIERAEGHQLLGEIATRFPGEFRSLTLGKPTLEDVFIKFTGRRMQEADTPSPAQG